ncbi:MAG: hypothetical protein LDL41_17700 [Coleofasciculus sp. S288]|nr:hypothetical protein [Coleofasciculus sp. S288]
MRAITFCDVVTGKLNNTESASAIPFFVNPQNFVETFRRNVSTTQCRNAIAYCRNGSLKTSATLVKLQSSSATLEENFLYFSINTVQHCNWGVSL